MFIECELDLYPGKIAFLNLDRIDCFSRTEDDEVLLALNGDDEFVTILWPKFDEFIRCVRPLRPHRDDD